jgi:8-oxo-dGTP pyrophosphatase MutT (NUDIX family)
VYLYLLRGAGQDTEVLLQLRGRTGYLDGHWAAAAAGHVEAGESVYAAAVREAREELGVTVALADLHPVCASHRTLPGNPDPIEQRVDFFLTANAWAGEPVVLEPVKCLELRWSRLDRLPSPFVPHELDVLARLHTALMGGPPVPAVLTTGF